MDQKHAMPLQTVTSKHLPTSKGLVETLYLEAERLFHEQSSTATKVLRTRTTQPIMRKDLEKGHIAIAATVTDEETGLYIQLTGLTDAKKNLVEGPFLTFGRVYVIETKNPQLSNTALRIFG